MIWEGIGVHQPRIILRLKHVHGLRFQDDGAAEVISYGETCALLDADSAADLAAAMGSVTADAAMANATTTHGHDWRGADAGLGPGRDGGES